MPPRRRSELLGLPRPVALAAAAFGLLVAAFLLYMTRGSNFHTDDWSFVLDRAGHSPGVFLEPHNEHLSLVPIAIFKALFELFGLGSYLPFTLVLIAVNLLCGALTLLLLRRDVAPLVALMLVIPLMLMGPAWSALYSPFQVSFSASMACGLGALIALGRGTRRADVLASALLIGALAASSLGIPWMAFVAVELALRDRRRLWVLAAPAVLYAAWYLAYNSGSNEPHPFDAMTFVLNAAATALGGYAGLGVDWGRSLLVAAVALGAWRIARLGTVPTRTVGAIAAGVCFWGLTGLVRPADSFGEPRYLLAGATFLVLAAAPLLPPALPSRGVLLGAAAAIVVALLAGATDFVAGRSVLVTGNAPLYVRLQALEQARGAVKDPEFAPDPERGTVITAARYFAALDRYGGSPARPLGEIRAAGPDLRREFDEALVGALGLAIRPTTGRPSGSCEVAAGEPLDLEVPAGGLRLGVPAGGDATVALRRLGDPAAGGPALTAPAGAVSELAIPPDRLEDPWHATVTGPAGTRVCGIGG